MLLSRHRFALCLDGPVRSSSPYFALLLVLGIAVGAAAAPANSTDPPVWIGTNDPTRGGAPDFWQLFEPNAPWPIAKSHVAVFGIDQNLVSNGPPDKLRRFFAQLKENHIRLAIGIGMLTWGDQCGKHVEGYVPPGGSDYVAKRIKWLGGDLAYISIDEASWFGRWYSGKNACHSSLDEVTSDIAINFKAYKAVFPNVHLGDTEPAGPPQVPNPGSQWLKNLQEWVDALQTKIGEPLAFFHQDITNWNRPLGFIADMAKLMKANHIPFAPIFIAANCNGPDAAWMASAERNIDTLRALQIGPPDKLVFATWCNHPSANLPESSPTRSPPTTRGPP